MVCYGSWRVSVFVLMLLDGLFTFITICGWIVVFVFGFGLLDFCCVGDLAGLNVLNLRLECWFDCLGVLLFMLVLVVVVLLGVAFGCVGWFCGLYYLFGGLLLLGLVGGCLVAFVLWLFVLVWWCADWFVAIVSVLW